MQAVIEVRRFGVVVTANGGTVLVKDGHKPIVHGRFEDMHRMVATVRSSMDDARGRWTVDMLRAVRRAHDALEGSIVGHDESEWESAWKGAVR